MSTKANVKKRHWTCVVYPESAPADWVDILQQTGLEFAISPLHDKDVNADGEHKKEHYHVILVYTGPTTFSNVCSLVVETLKQPFPQPLDSVKGYYRYFTHKDNPDKYQYDESEVRCFNGFNIFDFSELTRREIADIKMRIIALIRELGITEYSTLLEYFMDNQMLTEFEVAANNTYTFTSYLTSLRMRVSRTEPTEVDMETGEILE